MKKFLAIAFIAATLVSCNEEAKTDTPVDQAAEQVQEGAETISDAATTAGSNVVDSAAAVIDSVATKVAQ